MAPSNPVSVRPQRGPRPGDVVLAVQLWVFVIAASVVSRVAQAWSVRGSDEAREQFERDIQGDGFMAENLREVYPTFEAYDLATFVAALVMTGIAVVVGSVLVYLMWRGQGWAKYTLQILAGIVVYLGVISFFSREPLIAVPALLAAVAVVGASIAASSKDAQKFFNPKIGR